MKLNLSSLSISLIVTETFKKRLIFCSVPIKVRYL